MDNYYSRPEVSNSELTWLSKYWMPNQVVIDLEAAYRFGSLLDALITEPHLVNYFKRTVAGEQFSEAEFSKAVEMKKSFFKDSFCASLAFQSQMQKISIKNNFPIEYCGYKFHLDSRAKWDFFINDIDLAGDLKSTACTTQNQFEESISHFEYSRQAAWYMDLEGRNNFIFIGVSKQPPYKVFKVPVKRGSQLYNEGKAKYQELAFKYWYMFGDVNGAKNV